MFTIRPRYYLLLIVAIVVAMCLASCVTEKQRQRICNTCPVKDSVVEKITIVPKDTTIYITQQGPVQYLENPCKALCDSLGNLKRFEITKKQKGIVSTVKAVGNSIVFECKTDSLQAIITGLRDYIKQSTTVKNSVKYIPCQNERTNADGFRYWWFIITAALIGIQAGFWLFKRYFNK